MIIALALIGFLILRCSKFLKGEEMATSAPVINASDLFVDVESSGGLRDLPLVDVLDSPYQTRQRKITRESVTELMASLDAAGQLQPIIVSPADDLGKGKYYVHAGHRRCAALRFMGSSTVRARVEALTARQARKVVFCENQGREDVSAVELAEAISGYANECGSDFREAARDLGVPERTRKRLAVLAGVDPTLREALAAGEISARVADVLARLDRVRPGLGVRRAHAFASGRTTTAKLERELKNLRQGVRPAGMGHREGAVFCEIGEGTMRLKLHLETFDHDESDVVSAVTALSRCLAALGESRDSSQGRALNPTGPSGPGPDEKQTFNDSRRL